MRTQMFTYQDGAHWYRLTVRYGFDLDFARRNSQRPYFSITADLAEGRTEDGYFKDISGGCLHDLIDERAPELKGLIRWHMAADTGRPSHYVENGVYWAENAAGLSRYAPRPGDPDPVKAFKSTVVWGACDMDTDHELAGLLECPDVKAPAGIICEQWAQTAEGREDARRALREQVAPVLRSREATLEVQFGDDMRAAIGCKDFGAAQKCGEEINIARQLAAQES